MKAMIFREYGTPEVLKIEEIEKPKPKKNEVLIKIINTTVTAGDWRMRKADPFAARIYNGLFRPRKVNILGFELSGIIEEIGSDVTKFNIGDEVFASCGFGFGGYAEYRCLPEDSSISLKPQNISFEEAAAVPIGATTALRFLRKARISNGQKILIYGASGSVGTYALQYAKTFDTKVTAVCSTKNIDLVKSLGADSVIDYTKEDFHKKIDKYDIIFDAVGKISKSTYKKYLNKNGYFLSVDSTNTKENREIDTLFNLLKEEKIKVVIDRKFNFKDIPEAHKYVQEGHKVGNVIVSI